MNRLTGLLFLIFISMLSLAVAQDKNAAAPVNTCLSCHTEVGSPEAAAFQKDVHHGAGVTCADCHGGDPTAEDMEASMNPAKGYIGVPKTSDIPKICSKCHGDTDNQFHRTFHLSNVMKDFEASVHGTAWKQNSDGPQCISCHGIHNILKVKDPASPVYPTNVAKTCSKCHSDADFMKKFNPSLPVDQYEKYLTSIHGKRNAGGDPKTATCVSCHSNHLIYQVKDPRSPVSPMNIPATCSHCHSDEKYMANYHIRTDQYENYKKSVHGIALLKNSDLSAPACNSCHGNHGAAPPGVASVANVCGQCHQANAELFDKSIHRTAFDQMELPGCVVCHGNHFIQPPTDSMIGLNSEAACGTCHSSTDKAAPVIVKMQEQLQGLTLGQKDALKVLSRAEQLGMDVTEAKYSLKDVNQSLIEARVKVHSFETAPVVESAKPGIEIISKAKAAAEEATHEYYFRRKGLGVSTLIITALAIILFLKIKQIEQRQDKQP